MDDDIARIRAATAYHEAGHAVAAYVLRRAFTRVSIEADESTLGRCSFRPPGEWFRPDLKVDWATRRRLEERMMISLAGPEVEASFTGTYDPAAAQEDLDRAIDHACFMTGDEIEASAYVEWIRLRTVNLMKRDGFWPGVAALADELLARREVTYRTARAVIERALRAQPAVTSAAPTLRAARYWANAATEASRHGPT